MAGVAKARKRRAVSIAAATASVHVRSFDREGRTFCGRAIVAGARLAVNSTAEATCRKCQAGVEIWRQAESQRMTEARNRRIALARQARDIFAHRAGSMSVPYEHLSANERQAWLDVVDFLKSEIEDDQQAEELDAQ